MQEERFKPYRVRTNDGARRSQHDTLKQAEAAAKQANDAAEALGIKTRYEVHDESEALAA